MKTCWIVLSLALLASAPAFTPAFAEVLADSNDCYDQSRKGDNKSAIDSCTRAIESGELQDEDLISVLINRGVAYRATGEAQKAADDYTLALEKAPEDAVIYANRANALRDLGRLDDAFADADKAVSLNPKRGASFYTRGAVYEAKGETALARRDYFQALALDPENADYKKKASGG